MRHGYRDLWIMVCIPMLFALGCALSSLSPDGGGSGAGNARVVGVVLMRTGIPAAGIHVHVYPHDWLADTANADDTRAIAGPPSYIADSNGRFAIDSLPAGIYAIEANDGCSTAALFPCTLSAEGRVDLGTRSLQPYGSLKGSVQDIGSTQPARAYARIYGLNRVARADSTTGIFFFDNLPPGTFDVNIIAASPLYGQLRYRNAAVRAAGTTDIGVNQIHTFESENYAAWSYRRGIGLNTTPRGADIREPVCGFALLVRLDSSNFTFSQARRNGRDIRFSHPGGAHLRYEIARWDSAGAAADIWVRIDTVHATTDTQTIFMHWGGLDGAGWSNGANVFGASDGFVSVYHLESTSNVVNAAGGTPNAQALGAASIRGIIGNAADFIGTDYIALPPASYDSSNRQLTISVWQYGYEKAILKNFAFRGVDAAGRVALGADLPCNDLNIVWIAGFSHDTCDVAFKQVENESQYRTTWNYWAFTKNVSDGTMNIYLNGALWLAQTGKTKPLVSLARLTLGPGGGSNQRYDGRLDEFRIDRIERGAAWVKLCYENQRPDQRLLTFK